MTEFLKNNPIALRHCMLYAYLQRSYNNYYEFRKVRGKDVIDEKEFRFWCSRFEKGIFDDNEKPLDNIVDILRNNKHALRACVLYESLKYQQRRLLVFSFFDLDPTSNLSLEMYDRFVKVVGEDVMEYREFDFWFYRFLNEEFDLNFERDEGEKTYELTDMPIVVMRHIVEYLDISDRLALTKTSRTLQTFVEDQKLFHSFSMLTILHDTIYVSISTLNNIRYKRHNFQRRDSCIKYSKKGVQAFHGITFWEKGLLDFKSFIKNPKLHLNTLKINWNLYKEDFDRHDSVYHIVDEFHNSFNFTHYFNVKTLTFGGHFWRPLLKVLPSLKPGYLTNIDVFIDSEEPNEIDLIEEIVEMEQWKRAKCFTMPYDSFVGPLRHLYHFEVLTVRLSELSVEDIRQMKEILHKSPNLEKWIFHLDDSELESIIRQEFAGLYQGKPNTYHHSIPNSTEYFEILVSTELMQIMRKKK